MQGRKIAGTGLLAASIVAMVVAAVFASRAGGGNAPAGPLAQREPARISEALAAAHAAATRPRIAVAVPTPVATPTLRQMLLAADELRKAGKIAAPTPTLKETLEAADALVKAGAIAPPPTLEQVLQAADALVKAGVIAPPPTLAESMIAADKLRAAGMLPAEAQQPQASPTPTLQEILLAADAIRIANEAQEAAAPAAPPPAAEPPQSAPEPTSTPVPVQPTLPPPPAPTSTPVPPPPASPVPTQAPQQSGGTGYWDATFTAQVLALVNQRRAAAGLGPVAVESRLEESARDYAKVLADNNWFSHTGPDGSTLVSRVTATGFPFDVQIGEVLAWGTDHWQPAEIVQAWMDSPGHKEQLLGPYTRAGAGCYFTDGGSTVRCVIDFAG